jgi:hypothetical protein
VLQYQRVFPSEPILTTLEFRNTVITLLSRIFNAFEVSPSLLRQICEEARIPAFLERLPSPPPPLLPSSMPALKLPELRIGTGTPASGVLSHTFALTQLTDFDESDLLGGSSDSSSPDDAADDGPFRRARAAARSRHSLVP